MSEETPASGKLYRIKPLVWLPGNRWHITKCGRYEVCGVRHREFFAWERVVGHKFPPGVLGILPSLEQAKAVCEADHVERLEALLEPVEPEQGKEGES